MPGGNRSLGLGAGGLLAGTGGDGAPLAFSRARTGFGARASFGGELNGGVPTGGGIAPAVGGSAPPTGCGRLAAVPGG